jgi:hypothetical protein
VRSQRFYYVRFGQLYFESCAVYTIRFSRVCYLIEVLAVQYSSVEAVTHAAVAKSHDLHHPNRSDVCGGSQPIASTDDVEEV